MENFTFIVPIHLKFQPSVLAQDKSLNDRNMQIFIIIAFSLKTPHSWLFRIHSKRDNNKEESKKLQLFIWSILALYFCMLVLKIVNYYDKKSVSPSEDWPAILRQTGEVVKYSHSLYMTQVPAILFSKPN